MAKHSPVNTACINYCRDSRSLAAPAVVALFTLAQPFWHAADQLLPASVCLAWLLIAVALQYLGYSHARTVSMGLRYPGFSGKPWSFRPRALQTVGWHENLPLPCYTFTCKLLCCCPACPARFTAGSTEASFVTSWSLCPLAESKFSMSHKSAPQR